MLRSTLMVAEVLVAVGIGLALLQWLLRDGVIAAGAREAIVRAPYQRRQSESIAAGVAPGWLSAVQRRELRLLGRDRTFMVQTLVTPAVIIGTQFFLFMGFGASFNLFINAIDQPSNLAAIAFGLAAYTLMFSCFQTLNTEGQALWMLYCVPHSLASVLWQKAKLWASVAAIYPAILFAIAIVLAGGVSLRFVGSARSPCWASRYWPSSRPRSAFSDAIRLNRTFSAGCVQPTCISTPSLPRFTPMQSTPARFGSVALSSS